MDARFKKLKATLKERDVDALLLVNLHTSSIDPSIHYFTNVPFLTHACLLIPLNKEPLLLTAKLDYARAKRESWVEDVRATDNLKQDLPKLLREYRVKKLAVNDRFFTLEMMNLIDKDIKVYGFEETIYNLRMVKDEEEAEKIEKAAKITKQVISEIMDTVKPGIKENEVKSRLEYLLKLRGAEETAFPSIVLSGPRTSDPHASSSNRKVLRGEPLLIDCGAKYQGYCSDITRTFFVNGEPTGEAKEIYEVVEEAQRAAIKAVKPGVSNFQVDGEARKVISEHGYELIHGTGHGIGLEVHEEPTISFEKYKGARKVVLEKGMIFTVEPAIYVDGRVGVRIEDDVIVTDTGCKVF